MNARPDWIYISSAAAKVPNLSYDQVGYAITLRRQLADALKHQAARRSIGDRSPTGAFWSGVAAACRREVTRMERASKRLAASRGAA